MIKLINKHINKFVHFEITKFPDGTSQVWKIDPEPISSYFDYEVLWMFENEAELFHVCQLGILLNTKYSIYPKLNCPFLPYGRQDKEISNNTTFAREAFLHLTEASGYSYIRTYDSHSLGPRIESQQPKDFIKWVLEQNTYNMICFPDKGAKNRYSNLIGNSFPTIYCEKTRNQQTGEIEGLTLVTDGHRSSIGLIEKAEILIWDDLCDGGKTFVETTKLLKKLGATIVDLAVSHGIFSKGFIPLNEAGINQVYTTNSLLKNGPSGLGKWSLMNFNIYELLNLKQYENNKE